MANEVWPEGNMKAFFVDVTKAYAEHCGSDECVTFNPPETHGREPMHSQINLINRTSGNCFKIKLGSEE